MSEELTKTLLAQSAGIDVLVALVNIDPMKLSPSGRVDYLAALEKQGAWLQSLLQVAIVAVAGSEPSADAGNYSGVDDPQREEIASALNLAPVTAQSRIDVARVLTQHLPATCQALANGEISSAQATVIARESAALLRKGIDPDQLRFLETTAISYSEFHTPSQVTHKVRSIVAKLDPVEFEVDVAQAAQGRRVIFTPQPYGMAQILALLPAAEAQTIWLAIDKLARANRDKGVATINAKTGSNGMRQKLNSQTGNDASAGSDASAERDADARHNSGIGRNSGATIPSSREDQDLPNFMLDEIEPLSLDQLRADALTSIAQKFLAESENQNLAHGRPVTLNLTLDLPTLLGLQENPGILAGYGEIPASVARLLASDAKWKRFISDPISGNLLDFGRQTYQPPQSLVDFIVARDRRCRFPGCRQPARICDIDHAVPWEEGGHTSKENLGLLCRRHHRMKTHGGWKLTSHPDGSCDWISPEGQQIRVETRRIDELA